MKKMHGPLNFCADRIDVITKFAVITNVVINRFTVFFRILIPNSVVQVRSLLRLVLVYYIYHDTKELTYWLELLQLFKLLKERLVNRCISKKNR